MSRTPFDILEDYERRALAHVVEAEVARALDNNQWRGVGYRVGSRRLVSEFGEVVEIVPLPPLTPVPGAQPWLLGVGNLRGNLFPVIDLKQFLEGERTVLRDGQRVIVMRQPGGDVALTIDELYGQRGFDDDQLVEPGSLASGHYVHFIQRAYRSDGQEWGVFALSRLARTPEFRQAAL